MADYLDTSSEGEGEDDEMGLDAFLNQDPAAENDEYTAFSCNGTIIMFNAERELLWKQDYDIFDHNSVTLFFPQDATYLFAGGNSFVAAIDPSNGGLKWHQGFEQGFGRGPVTFAAHKHTTHHLDEKIYVGSKGKVKSLYARTGEKCWTKSLPDTGYEVVTLLTSADGALYAAAKGLVFRMASESGAILWTCKIKGLAYSKSYGHTTLALSGSGHELFYGLHGRIGALNAGAGEKQWMINVAKLQNSDTIVSLTVGIVDGVIKTGDVNPELVFVHTAGVVMALLPRLKGIVWERDLFYRRCHNEQGSLLYAPENGRLFLATCSHCVALCPLSGGIAWGVYVPRIGSCLPTLASLGGGVLLVAGGGDAIFLDVHNGTNSQAGQYLDLKPSGSKRPTGHSIMSAVNSLHWAPQMASACPVAHVAAVLERLKSGSSEEVLSAGHASGWVDHTEFLEPDLETERIEDKLLRQKIEEENNPEPAAAEDDDANPFMSGGVSAAVEVSVEIENEGSSDSDDGGGLDVLGMMGGMEPNFKRDNAQEVDVANKPLSNTSNEARA